MGTGNPWPPFWYRKGLLEFYHSFLEILGHHFLVQLFFIIKKVYQLLVFSHHLVYHHPKSLPPFLLRNGGKYADFRLAPYWACFDLLFANYSDLH